MFDDIEEVIDIINILKQEYNYNYTGDLEDLMKQDFIEFEGNGIDALFWFYYKGDKYLFKPLKNPEYNVWGEILSCELARNLNIPHAEYRIAIFGEKMGVVTKCLTKGKAKIMVGSEIFQKFYNEYFYKQDDTPRNRIEEFCENYEISLELLELKPYDRQRYVFNYLNNLDCISSILYTLKENDINVKKSDVINITSGILNMLIFDLITMQYDRHPSNWGIIKDNDNYYMCPMYDNSTSFGLNYPNISERIFELPQQLMSAGGASLLNGCDINTYIDGIIYDESPTLTVDTTDSINPLRKSKKTIPDILEHFFQITEKNLSNEIINMILSVDSNLIEEIIKEAEEKNHMKMDENLKNYILLLFDNHLNRIHEIATRYRRMEHGNIK